MTVNDLEIRLAVAIEPLRYSLLGAKGRITQIGVFYLAAGPKVAFEMRTESFAQCQPQARYLDERGMSQRRH